MPQTIVQVDAFTSAPFAGNPAAACVLAENRPDGWMQRVAQEMNLSETAFVQRRDENGSGAEFDLRWFTPSDEVDLCGHATLASAHVLWESGALAAGAEATFHTRSGRLTARQGEDGWTWMDFPAEPPAPCEAPGVLQAALGDAAPRYTGRNRMDYLILLESEKAVRAFQPNLAKLAEVEARGLIVTAPADEGEGYDFASRFFAPRVGVAEDPVTGSAHCALAPFWAERLGRDRLTGYQASARGGTVRVEARGERVALGGQAVTVLRGELLV